MINSLLSVLAGGGCGFCIYMVLLKWERDTEYFIKKTVYEATIKATNDIITEIKHLSDTKANKSDTEDNGQ